jgi:hypothetical protein
MNTQDDVVIDSVVARLSSELDVDALELEPLANVVDPEVVSAFITAEEILPGSELRFYYEGHEVTIGGDGTVTIERSD